MGVAHNVGRTEIAGDGGGVHVCLFCVLLLDSLQLSIAFCFHLVFLIDKIRHKQTQDLQYVQIVL